MSSPDQIAAAAYHAYESTRFHLRCTPLEPADWLKSAMMAARATAGGSAEAPSASSSIAAAAASVAPPEAVYLKLECEQRTGSFKARGALNAVLRTLRHDERRRAAAGGDPGASSAASSAAAAISGFTTASTGNHALATLFAVAQAAPTSELRIFVAENADPTKVARLRAAAAAVLPRSRVSVVVEGRDCCEAERAARRAAAGRRGWRYVSPYNDADVIAGQGSMAVELLSQLRGGGWRRRQQQQQQQQQPQHQPQEPPPQPQQPQQPQGPQQQQPHKEDEPLRLAVFVPVGGGGLVAGVASVLKAAAGPGVAVYGCQPAANDVMRRSVAEGRLLDLPAVAEAPSLSDATAGGVEPGSLTFPLCRDLVDRWVCATEQEIANAVVSTLEHGGKLVEGAAGCAIAAALQVARESPEELAGRVVVVVACGGNAGVAALKEALRVGRAVGLSW